MTDTSAFDRATVNIYYSGDEVSPDIYCPVTGRIVHNEVDPDSSEEDWGDDPKWASIPTVMFHYISLCREFTYLSSALAETINATRLSLGEDGEGLDDFEVLQEHVTSLGQSPLVLHIRTEGMACGPIGMSVYIGLDLAKG